MPLGAVLAVVLVASPGLAGHASSGSYAGFGLVADVVHVAAMSLWLGSLAILAGVVLVRPTLAPSEASDLAERTSRLALASVAAIVVTGVFQAWREIRSVDALRNTDYGHLLLVKVGIVVVVLVAAATSRNIVRDELSAVGTEGEDVLERGAAPVPESALVAIGSGSPPRSSGAPWVPDEGDESAGDDARRTWLAVLRARVALELVLAIAVLIVTSILVAAPPAVSITSGPASVTLQSSKLWIDVVVSPGQAGRNDVHLYALNPNGGPLALPTGPLATDRTFSAEIALPSRRIAPIPIPLRRLGPDHAYAPSVNLPIAGQWRITVRILLSETDETVLTGNITLR